MRPWRWRSQLKILRLNAEARRFNSVSKLMPEWMKPQMRDSLKPKPEKPKAKTGPKAAVLKLHGDWQAAIKKSLEKKKPVLGWAK